MSRQVSILIPVYGSAALTRACLESLHRNTPPGTAEILVVDDASPDSETRELLGVLEGDPRLQVIRQPQNGGFAKACNRGIDASTAPIVVLLNNDTEVQPGWLAPLLKALEDPQVGAAGSLLLYPGSTLVQHAGIEFHREGRELKPFHIGQFRPLESAPWACETREAGAVTGACIAFRKDALPGGTRLDEGYRNGYEDTDLCLRLKAAGLRILYCGDSRVTHHESVAVGRFSSEDENLRLFQGRWKEIPPSLPLATARQALEDLRARRNYLGTSRPAQASRVARSAKALGLLAELPLWEQLARGRFLPHLRLPPDSRQEIHRRLGIDRLQIRHR